ncbi:MAG: hypothetical protein RIG84_01420 [Roseovarius sp.]
MFRKLFLVPVMAAAVAFTGFTAAPAKADNTAEIITGIAALAIIGYAISEANDNRNYYVSRDRYYGYAPRRNYYRHHGHQRHHYNAYRKYKQHHYHRHDLARPYGNR